MNQTIQPTIFENSAAATATTAKINARIDIIEEKVKKQDRQICILFVWLICLFVCVYIIITNNINNDGRRLLRATAA